jgi:hypothetical protein
MKFRPLVLSNSEACHSVVIRDGIPIAVIIGTVQDTGFVKKTVELRALEEIKDV